MPKSMMLALLLSLPTILAPVPTSTGSGSTGEARAAGGPVHAALHPEKADVYFELGDLAGLLAAYDRAPLFQLLADERVQKLMTGLGADYYPSLRTLLGRALAGKMAPDRADAWLDGIKTLSFSLTAQGGDPAFAFNLVAEFGDATLAREVEQLLLTRTPGHEALASSVPGVQKIVLEGTSGWEVVVGSRLAIGTGAASPEEYVARAEKKAPGFEGQAALAQATKVFSPSEGTPVFWFALSRSLSDVLRSSGLADARTLGMLDELPAELNPVSGARVARMQMVGSRFVTEIFSGATGDTQGSQALGGAPLQKAWLEPVPSGAMLILSSALDGAQLGRELRAAIAKDESSTQALAAIESKVGFGPERMLERLGPAFCLYAMPVAGLALPETRIWVDCSDPAAFQADLEAFLGALGEVLPGFGARARGYKVKDPSSGERIETPVTTITLPPGLIELGPMISISPSFAPVGSKLVCALTSMDVKNELKRVIGGEGEPIVAGADALAARGLALPEGARSTLVMDWGQLLVGLYNLGKTFAAMAPDQVPFDLAQAPPAEIFTEHFKPTFYFSKPVEGGLYRRNEASFGVEILAGLAALGVGRSAAMAPMPAEEFEMIEVEPEEPGGDH